MRQLQAQDIFTFSRLLKKLNIKEQVLDLLKAKDCIEVKKEDGLEIKPEVKEDFGSKFIRIAVMALEDINLVEDEFYGFLVPISEKSLEEVKCLSLLELRKIFDAVFKDEGLLSFFKSATT